MKKTQDGGGEPPKGGLGWAIDTDFGSFDILWTDSLPTEHFSFSCDINREISEDKTPELEGFSVERPMMAESFTFDVPNLANFGLEGSSVAEMNDAGRSFTSNKELSIAEDSKMICNESRKQRRRFTWRRRGLRCLT